MTAASTIIQYITQLFTWIVVVTPWQQALIVRRGKHVKMVKEGIYIKVPFIDQVYKQDIRRRISVIRPQTLTTKDGFTITISTAIGYEIEDIETLYQSINDPEDTIESECAGILTKYITDHDVEDCTPEEIECYMLDNLELDAYGLRGQEFHIVSFAKVKTYRFINGDLAAWSMSRLELHEHRS